MDAPIAAVQSQRREPRRLALLADERLAALVGAGSERAFAALYRRHHQPLYRYCRSLLRDDADAQDALQGTFASAYAALRERRRDAPLRPWLYRIAHNEAISMLRRRRRHADLGDTDVAGSFSTEQRAAERERLAQLVADLQQLPERQRGALVMRELGGLSHEEIALALQTNASVAKQTIFEARRSLQEFAEGRAMSCDEVCRALSDGDRRVLRGRRVSAHVRDCAACAAFAAAIPARRAELRALAPPLAPAAATGLLARVLGHAAGHSGATTGVGAGLAGKSAGLVLASKAVVGAALLAGVTVGLSRTLPASQHARFTPRTVSTARSDVARARTAGVQATVEPRSRRAAAGSAKALETVPASHAPATAGPAGSASTAAAGSGARAPRSTLHGHGSPGTSRRGTRTEGRGNGSGAIHRSATAAPAPHEPAQTRHRAANAVPVAPTPGHPATPVEPRATREEAHQPAHAPAISSRETP